MRSPRPRRLLLLAASSLALMGGAALPAVALTPPPPVSTQNPTRSCPRPQAPSDLPPYAALRTGGQPNGMRYAIKQSAARPGQAWPRLPNAACSLSDNKGQFRLAHIIEHMAFNGSK